MCLRYDMSIFFECVLNKLITGSCCRCHKSNGVVRWSYGELFSWYMHKKLTKNYKVRRYNVSLGGECRATGVSVWRLWYFGNSEIVCMLWCIAYHGSILLIEPIVTCIKYGHYCYNVVENIKRLNLALAGTCGEVLHV